MAHIQHRHQQLMPSIKYGTLFYAHNRNVCYLTCKAEGVDLGFVYGNRLSGNALLNTKGRKQVGSLFFRHNTTVDLDVLDALLDEAVTLDQSSAAAGKR